MSHPIPIGAWVQIDRLPPEFETFPEETQDAFRVALRKNTIWIEAEYVREVGREVAIRRRQRRSSAPRPMRS
jgi:hypothetical protein